MLIAGVLVSIFRGLATPSESGAVGVFGALILAATNHWFDRLLIADGADHIEPILEARTGRPWSTPVARRPTSPSWS